MTGVNIIQALGLLLIIAAVVGGGGKLLGFDLPVLGSVPRALLAAALGAALIVWGPRVVEHFGSYRVTSASIAWDQAQGNACGATQNYTISVATTGGAGTVEYRLVLDGKRLAATTLDTPKPKTYGVDGNVTFSFNKATLDATSSSLQLEILSPNRLTSKLSTMQLTCTESPEDLRDHLQLFLVDYAHAVKTYGRSSSAVTHEFFGYPVQWYGRNFSTEEAFVCFIDNCDRPGQAKVAAANDAASCTFQPVKVSAVTESENGIRVKFDATVDWVGRQKGVGQTRLRYEVDRSLSGQPFRIRLIGQPRTNEHCD